MPKNIPNTLLQWLLSNKQYNRADCFAITLQNGQTIYSTTGQQPITIAGNTYYPTTFGAWERGAIQSEASYSPKSNSMSLTVKAGIGILLPGPNTSPVQLATDNFTRANENPLTTANWITQSPFDPLQIVSDKCEPTAVAIDCVESYSGVEFSNNQWAEITIGALAGAGDVVTAIVRQTGIAGYFADVDGPLGASTVISLIVSTETEDINIGMYTGTVSTGDKVRISIIGSYVFVSLNGVVIIAAIDDTYDSGLPGCGANCATTEADATITNFNAGNLLSAPTLPLMASIASGFFDAANVHVQTAYWGIGESPSAGVARGTVTSFLGQITKVSDLGRDKADFEVADMLYQLNLLTPPKLIMSSCYHQLFDSGCTLQRNNFQLFNSVSSGSSPLQINLADGANTAPWWNGVITFTQGYITFTSGKNIGLNGYIKNLNSNTQILLAAPMPFPVAVGDTFTMYAGCDKSLPTCQNGFNNKTNFGGQGIFTPNPELGI